MMKSKDSDYVVAFERHGVETLDLYVQPRPGAKALVGVGNDYLKPAKQHCNLIYDCLPPLVSLDGDGEVGECTDLLQVCCYRCCRHVMTIDEVHTTPKDHRKRASPLCAWKDNGVTLTRKPPVMVKLTAATEGQTLVSPSCLCSRRTSLYFNSAMSHTILKASWASGPSRGICNSTTPPTRESSNLRPHSFVATG
eukprot:gnl/TRDRNA2_/TRDRNA2_177518_c3_seq9.p1 gnl/TRDRNA2_/TRDRNA2_177518_c3~~gnl/TRDRNA2_/TRDRNA2_177518_c3_seq9.p1  ORF type:complete len:195 (-),score=11.16 gnl/TRDRNA2_/TRDRNA2_177518_c3_seq9:313-897(-)